jgi:hypothetical protein
VHSTSHAAAKMRPEATNQSNPTPSRSTLFNVRVPNGEWVLYSHPHNNQHSQAKRIAQTTLDQTQTRTAIRKRSMLHISPQNACFLRYVLTYMRQGAAGNKALTTPNKEHLKHRPHTCTIHCWEFNTTIPGRPWSAPRGSVKPATNRNATSWRCSKFFCHSLGTLHRRWAQENMPKMLKAIPTCTRMYRAGPLHTARSSPQQPYPLLAIQRTGSCPISNEAPRQLLVQILPQAPPSFEGREPRTCATTTHTPHATCTGTY